MGTKRQMLSLFALCTPTCPDTVWESWYRFCMQQEQENAFTFSHVSCKTETLKPTGIRTRSRYLKKIDACMAKKEAMSNLEFYLLPKEFRQAVFDFQVYIGLSLSLNFCEITVENHFWKEFKYQEYLDAMKEFLNITKVEVNLLPYDQTFNYNVNCIAASNDSPEKYNVLQRIYAE